MKVKSVVYKCPRCNFKYEELAKDGVVRLGNLSCSTDMALMGVEGFTYETPVIEDLKPEKKKVKK